MVSWLRANGKIIFRGAALLLAGAAAGFGLGLFFAVPAGPGCQESDLTPVPDTGFASPAPEAAPASSLPQEEPMPEKWVCLTFDDGPSKTTPAVLDALNTGDNDRFHLETLHHSKQEIRRILERGGKIDRTVEYAVDDEEEEYEQYHGFSMRM